MHTATDGLRIQPGHYNKKYPEPNSKETKLLKAFLRLEEFLFRWIRRSLGKPAWLTAAPTCLIRPLESTMLVSRPSA
jgi:hypothetical protein